MRSRIKLATMFLGIILAMLSTTTVYAADIEPNYKVGEVYQYELVGPSGTGVFQVKIQAIDLVGNAINVSFVASSNDNTTFLEEDIKYSSNWTSTTELLDVSALWDDTNDSQIMTNAELVLSGFVIFPDLGTPYELHAIDSPQETYYNLSIDANGLLSNARIRFTGFSYTIRPFRPAIPGFSPVLLSLFTFSMVLGVYVIVRKRVSKDAE